MKRKYILMSMIAAATLASCSKDDSDNKIDNNNNSVVEVEKTIESGVKETVENSVETIACPVSITVNKGNSVSKVGYVEGKEIFTDGDQLKVVLDGKVVGTLRLETPGSDQGRFTGNIEIPKPEGEYSALIVDLIVSKLSSQLSGFSAEYGTLDEAVWANAFLMSSRVSLSPSDVAVNAYPSYSTSGVQLTDQTSYLVVSKGTAIVDINGNNFDLKDGSVFAFNGGLVISSTALGISNWTTAAGRKYNLDLTAVSAITLNESVIDLESLNATADLTATIKPSTATSTTITWLSSAEGIVSVDTKGTVKAEAEAGEATITATANNGKSATCLVRVNRKVVTFTDGTNFLTLTYYDGQDWIKLNDNNDNKDLGLYSAVNNYYVKFGGDYLKKGDNYVKVTDEIENGATYTLVDNAPTASITLGDYTIFYSEGETWGEVAKRADNNNIPIDADGKVNINGKYLIHGDDYVGGSNVIDANGGYSFEN